MTLPDPAPIAVADADLRVLFDIAVTSLDFGSGFLDTDEVNALRRVAVAIGVDPLVATPPMFAKDYPHRQGFRPNPTRQGVGGPPSRIPERCCWEEDPHAACHRVLDEA